MPRRSKGPRLWFRPARGQRAGAWFILDGISQRGCGLGSDATAQEKEQALADYLKSKHVTTVSSGSRDPSQIPVADVISKYSRDKDPPYETGLRLRALLTFWRGKTLSEVTGDTCRAYAATRTQGAARRELEDFRAAINHHRREGLCDKVVSVVLPPKGKHREDYLTRGEAAGLIWHAWRYREKQNARATDRATRKHVARFMVVARYMGSRAGVICEASIEPKRPADRAWVNLNTGMFYGLPQGREQTRKRRQLVRVPTPLLAHMRRWRARGQSYVVEWNGASVAKIRKAHGAVVKAVSKGLVPPFPLMEPKRKKERVSLKRHVTPHIWRHTVATWLMQDGAEPFKAAGFLAMSVETLLRVYGHHHPDHSADVHETMRKRKAA